MSRKNTLLDLLQLGHFQENAFYDSLTQDERDRKGSVDDWAPKDVIAHVAFWKKMRAGDMQRVKDGQTIDRIEDFDSVNAEVFERFQDQTWTAIMAFAEEASAALMKQIDKMSEEDLNLEWHDDQAVWHVALTNGYSHPLMHIADHHQHLGDLQRAAEITAMLGKPTAALDSSPTWLGTILYNTACSLALFGKKEEAITELSEALAMRPELTEWSKQDTDLASLRDDPAYFALYE